MDTGALPDKVQIPEPFTPESQARSCDSGASRVLPADVVRSVVVFTGDAEFKTNIPDGVFTVAGFLAFVEGTTAEVMSVNRLHFCVGRLETTRLSITKATDIEHVQGLRRRHGNDQ